VAELEARERAKFMHRVCRAREHRNILIGPDAQLDEGADFGGGMNLGLLGAYDAPAALRLDGPHRGERGRVAIAHAVAVRHLEKAVLGGDGADPHLLEQNIVTRITHLGPIPFTPAADMASWAL
jgi:hypothetical protein